MKKLLKKLLKRITFIHALLLMIVLVLFLGLFKKEISVWKRNNFPSIVKRAYIIKSACIKTVENPKWNEGYQDYWNKCYAKQKYAVECATKANNALTEAKISMSIDIKSTCEITAYKKWFYAFGKSWFQVN